MHGDQALSGKYDDEIADVAAGPVTASWSPMQDELNHATTRALIFKVDNQSFAISVDFVEKVLEVPAATPVPGSSEWFTGMVCYETEPVALIDTGYFLYQKRTLANNSSRAILVNCAHGRLVLMVQRLVTLCDLSARVRMDLPTVEYPASYTEYVCQHDGEAVTVLNLAALLSDARECASSVGSSTAPPS